MDRFFYRCIAILLALGLSLDGAGAGVQPRLSAPQQALFVQEALAAQDVFALRQRSAGPLLARSMQWLRATGISLWQETHAGSIWDPEIPAPDSPAVSPAERQVLELDARGLSARKMARKTQLSVPTVNEYLRRARAKLGILEARAFWLAHRGGLVAAPPPELQHELAGFMIRLPPDLQALLNLVKEHGYSIKEIGERPDAGGIARVRGQMAKINRVLNYDKRAAILRTIARDHGYALSGLNLAVYLAHQSAPTPVAVEGVNGWQGSAIEKMRTGIFPGLLAPNVFLGPFQEAAQEIERQLSNPGLLPAGRSYWEHRRNNAMALADFAYALKQRAETLKPVRSMAGKTPETMFYAYRFQAHDGGRVAVLIVRFDPAAPMLKIRLVAGDVADRDIFKNPGVESTHIGADYYEDHPHKEDIHVDIVSRPDNLSWFTNQAPLRYAFSIAQHSRIVRLDFLMHLYELKDDLDDYFDRKKDIYHFKTRRLQRPFAVLIREHCGLAPEPILRYFEGFRHNRFPAGLHGALPNELRDQSGRLLAYAARVLFLVEKSPTAIIMAHVLSGAAFRLLTLAAKTDYQDSIYDYLIRRLHQTTLQINNFELHKRLPDPGASLVRTAA